MISIHTAPERRNSVADMILACIQHYKKYNVVIDTIKLEPVRWAFFKAWLMKSNEEIFHDTQDEVHFKDVKIKKSQFQTEPLIVEIKAKAKIQA